MRVKVDSDCRVYWNYMVQDLKKDQVVDGDFAEHLSNTGAPVTALDEDGDGVPDGTIDQTLAWVNEDPEQVTARAAAALAAEQAKGDKARSTLVDALTKLAEPAGN